MEQLLNKILLECDYRKVETDDLPYYTKENKSFFFLLGINHSDFIKIKSQNDFKNNEQYKSLLGKFNQKINRSELAAIEKNYSLIIFIKSEDLPFSLLNYQQQSLLLEEDEYFFKKYVIFYTDPSISELIISSPVVSLLQEKVNNTTNFEIIANEGYKTELAEYLIIVQLFIKLPFLKLSFGLEGYKTLNEKLVDGLANLMDLYHIFLKKEPEIKAIDFMNIEHEQAIEELIKLLPND